MRGNIIITMMKMYAKYNNNHLKQINKNVPYDSQ